MRRVLIVAWREFRQTVFRKVFLLAVLGLPLLIVVLGGLAALMMASQKQPPLVGTLVVVDADGTTAAAAEQEFTDDAIRDDARAELEAVAERLRDQPTSGIGMTGPSDLPTFGRGEVRVTIEPRPGIGAEDLDALKTKMQGGDPLALAIIPDGLLSPTDPDDGRFELFVSPKLDSDHVSLIERRLGKAIVRVRADRAGLDPDAMAALLARPGAATTRLLEDGETASEGEGARAFRQLIPMVFMMLLWVAVFTAGQHLLMSTIEEKSNRVMEVLLSAVSPLQLMTGKILGQGGVGLLVVLIYSPLILVGLVALSVMHVIEPMMLVYLFVFFLMAYFMIASLMAAVGSAVSDIREANTLMTPVMLVLMVPLALWMPISNDPNGLVATIFSFVPPAIPFAMLARVAADEPVPGWQIPVAILWGGISTVAMVWMAARIFRVGVLMYGKPPSPLELLRWIRHA